MEKLCLYGIKLTKDIITSINQLEKINVLSLRECKFNISFINLKNLKNLDSLWLGHNNSDNIDIQFSPNNRVTALYLDSANYKEVPNWIRQCNFLMELLLDDNHILELPEWLHEMKHLKQISLWDNQIPEIAIEEFQKKREGIYISTGQSE